MDYMDYIAVQFVQSAVVICSCLNASPILQMNEVEDGDIEDN
jgi:hypothetical protein